MHKWAIAILAACLAAAPVAAWGPTGHTEVGRVADSLLGGAAKRQVREILGLPLATAGPWMDCLRDVRQTPAGPRVNRNPTFRETCGPFWNSAAEAEMIAFTERNTDNCDRTFDPQACHFQYHFEDIALQRSAYAPGLIGTGETDVVHAINAAIAVLQDRPAPPHFDIANKREALLMLAHLVGDIHQPLHVGAVYLDASGNRIDPDSAHPYDPDTFTRGGNFLFDGSKKLHGLWDGAAAFPTGSGWATVLREARAVPATSGPIESWAEAWANETLGVSQAAFADLTFASRASAGHWDIRFADRSAYLRRMKQVQRQQVERAGARLAQILNMIWPSP